MDIRKSFGERVKELRIKSNLSQEALSHLAGIDRTYLPSIEKGNRNVSIEIAWKLASAFQIRIEELFKGIENER